MEQLHDNSPRVIFVTGGPGTGKGTQCPKLVEEFGYKHVSIGDLMRAEIKSGSEEGKNIVSIVQSGGLVPKELTVSLLQKSLSSISAHTVLVDGFPRSVDQALYLEQIGVRVKFLLHFDTDKEDVLLNRLIERGKISGRADDNEETIVKRFKVYKSESLPVLQLYEPFGVVRKVNCMGTVNEVFFRTLCALRPETFFIAGAKSSGKSTLAEALGRRYYFFVLDLQRVIKKTDGSDEAITRKLVQTLQGFKHESRVLVDGFPMNENQARLFSGMLGLPNKVLFLECPPDVCQERQLALGKKTPGYISSNDLSKQYAESVKTYSALSQYYSSTLSSHFKKINSRNVEQVFKEASSFVEPEVLLVRGNIRPCFLIYFKEKGFKLVNVVHLIELWRNARGQSVSENQSNLSDDLETIDVIRDLVFSGNATEKFLIYNFALGNPELIEMFERRVCKISKVFQLYSGKEVSLDRVNCYFASRPNFFTINSEKISYKRKLLPEDKKIIEDSIRSQSPADQSQFIFLLGASLTGKTTISKHLQRLGMRIMDFSSFIEETKARLSTEEEPKEDLSFSEIIESLQEEAKKNPFQKIIFDGLPPSEVLFAKDPLWPFPESDEKAEEELPFDEDPSIQSRVSSTALRMKILMEKLQVLSVIHLKVPYQVLEKRARKKFEVPEEEDLNNEQKSQIFESWMISQRLYSKPVPSRFFIPQVLSFNTEKVSIPQISAKLQNVFKRKCVLVESNYPSGFDAVKKMALKHLIPCIDFSLLSAGDPSLSKQDLLKSRALSLPPNSRYVILCNFPFKLQEFQSILEDFTSLEDWIGRLHKFYIFSSKEVNPETFQIDPSPRSGDSHVVMWNNSELSSQYKVFSMFKGEPCKFSAYSIDYNNYSQVVEQLVETIDDEGRLLMNFVMDESSARGFQSYFYDEMLSFCGDFKEHLFLDLSSLDTKKKIQNALKNPLSKEFHDRYLKAYTVPFCLFFEHFTKVLKEEELVVTSGLRKSIKESIDLNKNSFIDAEEVSLFFDSWGISEEREMIINRGVSYDRREVIDKLGYSLIFLVEQALPDAVTGVSSFKRGESFEIQFEGLKNSKRFCADRTVYFGKENPQFKNDIEFNSADTRVSISHFQIHSKKTGYFLVDNSNSNVMKLQIFEIPVTLFEDCLIFIGEHQIRVKTLTVPLIQDDDVLKLNFRGRSSQIDPIPVIELEFLSESLYGLKFNNSGKKVLTIGSSSSSDLVIYGASPCHAIIELRKAGWCIKDNHTVSGTYISINSFYNISYKKPSPALQIVHGMRFEVAGLSFRLLQKSSSKLIVDVNNFQQFRFEKFSDHYSIVRHLSKSVLGEKYIVRHLQSKQYFIAKMVSLEQITEDAITEMQILKQLDHPNTVRVVDTIADYNNKLYIISEMCTGPELMERIMSKGSHSEENACRYIRQVLQGLAYLHSNGVLCRDLRPENLQFADGSEDSLLKICEFANAIETKGFVDKIVASSHYLAPEVFSNVYTSASDIWACGVLLYTLLVGVPPFTGKTDADVRKKAMKGNPGYKEKAWARVSNHAKRVVRLLLTFDYLKRPTAEEVLNDPWVKQSLKFLDISKPMIARTFKNFKHFYSSNKLQHSIYMFIAENLNNNEIKKQAADLFTHIDLNGDGKVSVQELVAGMADMGILMSEQEIQMIIQEVDGNGNGWVDFSEFLTVFTTRQNISTKENLEKAFSLFDADGSGEISTSELKRILGQSENEWSQIIKEIDENKDGKIDLKEFKNLLLRVGS
jgi:calcium-dependent protein kinase